jgi:tyrosyl-tRNA synthetase
MQKLKSDFLNAVQERGLLYQCTDLEGLDRELAAGKPMAGYWGADPTADSLHIGNLAALGLMRWFQKTGNKPILLVGGATGRIGDPSGRDTERQLLDEATLQKNMAGIKKSLQNVFKDGITYVDNYDWFKDVKYIEFLRDYGKFFSVNEMVKRDIIRLRLERGQPLSFLEFNYSLFQAYDFVQISKKYGATVQFGGADQWANLVSGVDLGRRTGLNLYAVTTSLITDANGVKFGKSMGNAVWLNEDKVSAHDYYQFWRNADDRDVGKLLRIFTDLPIAEIEKLEKLSGAEINEAKKILAFEATKICRGEAAAKAAAETAKTTFEAGGAGAGLPAVKWTPGMGAIDAFVAAGLSKSKSDAKRMCAAGGLYINDAKITDDKMIIGEELFKDGKIILSAGKKNKAVLAK